MRKNNAGRRWLTSVAAAAAIATITLSGGTAALASVPKPEGGGSGPVDCKPKTYIYASGSTIHFNGWTKCTNAIGFELQIGYNQIGGTTKYSSVVTCRGTSVGGSSTAQLNCGINGVSATMTDGKSGSQKWCVNTHILTGGPGGKQTWSLAECINH